jgi:hypothetical protein
MNAFVRRFAALVLGVLSGFDRLVFRGHLRQLSYTHGMNCYLSANHILFKDFGRHAEQVSAQLLDASLAQARHSGREIRYLPSSQLRKEDIARAIAQRDGISAGLICVLKCVEPCLSFEVHRNRARRRLELQARRRKCLYLYHYYQHPTFGFMHARIQTWFPFPIQVCLNGREWLARQMDQAGLAYQRRDNCFTWLADNERAQALCDQQLRVAWPDLLAGIRRDLHPAHPALLGRLPVDYYWSVHQSEWASDLMFRARADLEALYPRLVRHALTTYDSAAVMRFLGRRVPASGQVQGNFDGEVVSDGSRRVEGVRVKHRVNDNAVKMYDKGSVLRIETTLNNPRDFKVYRTKENEPQGQPDWRVLRKGVADLHRRAEVSQAANERYGEALAAVSAATPLRDWAEPLCRRVPGPGKTGTRPVRALNPLSAADACLLEAVSRPEFVVNGLRNRDLVALLYGVPARDQAQRQRRSAQVTRQLRLLRAHGLLHKVPKTHRYMVSPQGRQAITALLAARAANTDMLTSNAA